MDKLECFGEVCPIPLLKLQKKLKTLAVGESTILVVDHSCVVEAIAEYYKETSFDVEIDEVLNGVWEIFVTRLA